MQVVNNYNKEWYLKGSMRVLTAGAGVFNGDIGRIDSIDPSERTLEVLFDDDRLAEYSQNELAQLEHAYAVTVHKSQGSEFDTVILPLYYGYSEFLTRNLLYTAITRAKRKMIVIGSQRTVQHMIANARVSRRFTALDHELRAQAEMVAQLGENAKGQGDEWDELFRMLEEDKKNGSELLFPKIHVCAVCGRISGRACSARLAGPGWSRRKFCGPSGWLRFPCIAAIAMKAACAACF